MFGNMVLSLQGVGKDFGHLAALNDINFTLEAGQILCLVGRSGCGKSTLLRLIGGVERPDRGVISLNGSEIAGPSGFVEPDQRQIGFVFQDYALFPHLTVEENIAFGIRQLTPRQRDIRVREMLELVGLQSMAKRYAHSLSGGEQQRIALARALAPSPKLILMDEPFSNLDLNLKRRVRAETLSLLRQVGATAILVTHDPQEALAIGDKVILLSQGSIVQQGTSDNLYRHPVAPYAAEFFGEFNVVKGLVKGGRVQTDLGAFINTNDLHEGSMCRVYIRPSSVRFASEDDDLSFEATLHTRLFQGDVEELTYRIEHPSMLLKMLRLTGSAPAPVRARLVIGRHSALVFAD